MLATTTLKKKKYLSILRNSTKRRIGIPTSDGIEMLDIHNILRIEANRSYSIIHCIQQQKLIVSKPLKELASSLPDELFFRVHNSHLVNIDHITRLSKNDGGTITLRDNSKVPISRRRIKDLAKTLLD